MRVLVAGASGDVGTPVVEMLLERGDDVVALSRSTERAAHVIGMGARHVAASALDAGAVKRALAEAEPDAVVDLLTALPRNGPLRASHLEATNELRRAGSANLLAAAEAAGVDRYVGESIAFVYGYSAEGSLRTEDDAPAEEGQVPADYRPAIAAALGKERMMLEAGGTALRFGLFYGADVGSTRFAIRMLRRRMMALPGGGAGILPWIHVGDAASAVLRALDTPVARGRLYNVVDDEPASWRQAMTELARRLGTPPPYGIPAWLAKPFAPYAAEFMGRTRLLLSNERAKRELGWALDYPTYREGMAHVAAMVLEEARGRRSVR